MSVLRRLALLFLLRRLAHTQAGTGVYLPGDIGSVLAGLARRIRGLETQQQMTLTNQLGQPVLNFGLVPGSNPPAYGLQFVSPTTGEQLMFIGEKDGAAAVTFYNDAGGMTLQLSGSTVTFYDGSGNVTMQLSGGAITFPGSGGSKIAVDDLGMHAYNPSGVEEARMGVISATQPLYGLEVANSGGTLQQVAGVEAAGAFSLTTGSTVPVQMGAGPAAVVGPSGQALVTISGSAEMNGESTGGGYAYMGVGVDATPPSQNWVNNQTNLANAQLTTSVSATQVLSGLSPGRHTFSPYGWISSSGTSSGIFGLVYVVVIPL